MQVALLTIVGVVLCSVGGGGINMREGVVDLGVSFRGCFCE